eukprot:TRINITY_DN2500_c0_g1_i3.p1 TRINITY_DN2500_c0_g1~~TRINITY_DN2500_c0_g1_i3.p1  ORF type:complete len:216 (+),score=-12.89 TRINITY_DN2500_c0_g1_i3:252-899(+)
MLDNSRTTNTDFDFSLIVTGSLLTVLSKETTGINYLCIKIIMATHFQNAAFEQKCYAFPNFWEHSVITKTLLKKTLKKLQFSISYSCFKPLFKMIDLLFNLSEQIFKSNEHQFTSNQKKVKFIQNATFFPKFWVQNHGPKSLEKLQFLTISQYQILGSNSTSSKCLYNTHQTLVNNSKILRVHPPKKQFQPFYFYIFVNQRFHQTVRIVFPKYCV